MSYRSNGPSLIAPPTTGWTWYNQGSGAATTVGNSIQLWMPRVGGSNDNLTGYCQAIPATPFTLIAHFKYNPASGIISSRGDSLKLFGLGFTDGTQTEIFGVRASSTNTSAWSVLYSTSSVVASANLGNNYQDASGYPLSVTGWQMLRDDGTNIYYYFGDDSGKNFELAFSEAKGAHLGAITKFGLFADVGSTLSEVNWICDSWQVLNV